MVLYETKERANSVSTSISYGLPSMVTMMWIFLHGDDVADHMLFGTLAPGDGVAAVRGSESGVHL